MNCKKRNREEPLQMASAIVTLVSNLHKSKCNTFHKLARARVMKFAYLQKQTKQIAGSQMRPERSPQSARAIALQQPLQVTRAMRHEHSECMPLLGWQKSGQWVGNIKKAVIERSVIGGNDRVISNVIEVWYWYFLFYFGVTWFNGVCSISKVEGRTIFF